MKEKTIAIGMKIKSLLFIAIIEFCLFLNKDYN